LESLGQKVVDRLTVEKRISLHVLDDFSILSSGLLYSWRRSEEQIGKEKEEHNRQGAQEAKWPRDRHVIEMLSSMRTHREVLQLNMESGLQVTSEKGAKLLTVFTTNTCVILGTKFDAKTLTPPISPLKGSGIWEIAF
jgi:hypothetical protein